MLPVSWQGLDWYQATLKQDRDGDVADEFLLERSDQSTKGAHSGLQVCSGYCENAELWQSQR